MYVNHVNQVNEVNEAWFEENRVLNKLSTWWKEWNLLKSKTKRKSKK